MREVRQWVRLVFRDAYLVSRVVGVHGNSCITEHGLNTRSRDLDSLVRALDGVFEVDNHTKLNLLVVSWDIHERAACEFLVAHFEV